MSDTGRATSSTLAVGARLGDRYRVERLLGAGGMGQVYEVEHEALARRFALKLLRLDAWSDELLKRFQREARALGKIRSSRVAAVTDFGVDGKYGPFYVMELLDGETLGDRLDRDHRLAWDAALPVAVELCEALAEVHGEGIVHRDLKPSNIGLLSKGPIRVKLLDFGLAAALNDAMLERLTQSQQFIGTLPYMAPEQFEGADPSPSMDLYALGIVLYETVVGRRPFVAPTAASLVQQHLMAPMPPIVTVDPSLAVPAWFEAVLSRLLAKDPAARYPGAGEAAVALRMGMGAMGTPVRTLSPSPPSSEAARAVPPPSPAPPTNLISSSSLSLAAPTHQVAAAPAPRSYLALAVAAALAILVGSAIAATWILARTPRPSPPAVPARVSVPAPSPVPSPAAKVVPVAASPAVPVKPAAKKRPPQRPKKDGSGGWNGEVIEDPDSP